MSHVNDHDADHGSVYDGLVGGDPSHWAFGTDFEDPLAGVDTTVAEGVETPAQLEQIRRTRCDAVQGYLLARPMPADEVAAILARDPRP